MNCMVDSKENNKFDLGVKGLMNFSQSPTFAESDAYFKHFETLNQTPVDQRLNNAIDKTKISILHLCTITDK